LENISLNTVGKAVNELNLEIDKYYRMNHVVPKVKAISLVKNPFIELCLIIKNEGFEFLLRSDALRKDKILFKSNGFRVLGLEDSSQVALNAFKEMAVISKEITF
jgi:hypothetical protein